MTPLDFSQQRFVPGQPIAMHKSSFTPDLQEAIIGNHFNKAIPGAYETLMGRIAEQEAQASQQPNQQPVQPQSQEPAINPDVVNNQLDQMFRPVQQQPVQNPGYQNEPQPADQQQQPAVTPNENDDLMQRIFGDLGPQTRQNEQQPPVTTNQPNDARPELADNVRKAIADVCTTRGIAPAEFVQFATSVTIEDIADLYVAYKTVAQQAPAQQQAPVQQQQYAPPPQQRQVQGFQNQNQQQTQYIPETPLNLAEVQPNPQNYALPNPYQGSINKFWK